MLIHDYLYDIDFGNIFNLCCAMLGAICAGLTSYLLYRQNQKMDSKDQQFGKETAQQMEQVG